VGLSFLFSSYWRTRHTTIHQRTSSACARYVRRQADLAATAFRLQYIPLLFATACLSATSVERTIDLAVVFKLNGQVHFLSSKPKIPNGARAP
jgi:hypothetical protein